MLEVPGYRILSLSPKRDEKSVMIIGEAISGGLPERGESILFPGERRVRIKSTRARNGRVELVVKGAPRSALVHGAVLVPPEWPISECREALLLYDGEPVPAEAAAVRGGFTPGFNRERLIGNARFRVDGAFIRVRFPSPYPLMPGSDLSILHTEGRPRRLTVFHLGRTDTSLMRRLKASARRRPQPHPEPEEIFNRLLHLNGFVRFPPHLPLPTNTAVEKVGDWIITTESRRRMERTLVKRASRPGGANLDILRIENVPDELIRSLAKAMAERLLLVHRKAWFFPPGEPPLSPFHRSWLSRVKAAGTEGIRVRKIVSPADRNALQALERSGLICGGNELWLSADTLAAVAAKIRERYTLGGEVVMSDIREFIGGSRAFTIEFLALLEADGFFEIQPDGVTRLVL